MSHALHCKTCHAPIHPTGRTARVRCEYCGADTILDGMTHSALAASAPVAPPIGMSEIESSLTAHQADAPAFLEHLAKRLTAALPGRVEMRMGGGLITRSHVTEIDVTLGSYEYTIGITHGRLYGKRVHSVRGIALKTQDLTAGEVVEAIAAEMFEMSRQGEESRKALERFMAG